MELKKGKRKKGIKKKNGKIKVLLSHFSSFKRNLAFD